MKAPGFDGAVLRLQRAKIERERLKQAAERAFDYTAPPPPKNMQAISQLALPVSSRVINGKSTANTTPAANIAPAGNPANDGIKTRDELSHDSNQSQLSRGSFGAQHSSHNHMSPAVAAALSKVQSKQSSHKNPAKMSPELLLSVWRDLAAEKAGRVTPDNAVGRDGSSWMSSFLFSDNPSEAVDIARSWTNDRLENVGIPKQFRSDFFPPLPPRNSDIDEQSDQDSQQEDDLLTVDGLSDSSNDSSHCPSPRLRLTNTGTPRSWLARNGMPLRLPSPQ